MVEQPKPRALALSNLGRPPSDAEIRPSGLLRWRGNPAPFTKRRGRKQPVIGTAEGCTQPAVSSFSLSVPPGSHSTFRLTCTVLTLLPLEQGGGFSEQSKVHLHFFTLPVSRFAPAGSELPAVLLQSTNNCGIQFEKFPKSEALRMECFDVLVEKGFAESMPDSDLKRAPRTPLSCAPSPIAT